MPRRRARPVRTNTTVTSLHRTRRWLSRRHERRRFSCRCVVIASGACNRAERPAASSTRCLQSIEQFTPLNYRNPAQLPEGGVLVVGPSATGVQLAGGDSSLGPPSDAFRRRARPPAAHLSRTRRAVVDGVVRRMESAIRPDRRHHARAEAPVAAARWHS